MAQKISFERWMAVVDIHLLKKTGCLTSQDMMDAPYADWYEDGVSAKSAASKAIKFQE